MNYKYYLQLKPNVVNGLAFQDLPNGLNHFVVNGVIFPSFFIPSANKNLYVFLSAVGRVGRSYPLFHRISWSEQFDGNKLYFDDPTRAEKNISTCYYFGHKNHNYLEEIAKIIEYFTQINKIENKNICFISSSNGGFAAIYLANKFYGSRCIAMCPQLDIKTFYGKSFHDFENTFSISFDDPLLKNRINLYSITENKKTKFLIYSNIRSKSDKLQIDNFCKSISYQYHTGMNKIADNLYLFIVNIDALDPHLAQPDILLCKMLDKYQKNNQFDLMYDEINIYSTYLQNYYTFQYRNNITNKFIHNIIDFPCYIEYYINNKTNKKGFDIYFDNKKTIFLKLYDYDKKMVTLSLRIQYWKNYFSLEEAKSFCLNNDFNLDYDDNIMNIYSKKLVNIHEIYQNAMYILKYFNIKFDAFISEIE